GETGMEPRRIRNAGARALVGLFERLVADRPGSHDVHEAGGTGEPPGETRQWRWGDPFRIQVQRTVGNALMRTGPTRGRVRLHPDDFEIEEAENRTSTATVLLLDMSLSMP